MNDWLYNSDEQHLPSPGIIIQDTISSLNMSLTDCSQALIPRSLFLG